MRKKLIDKDAIVAEIERRIEENKAEIQRAIHKHLEEYFEGYEDLLGDSNYESKINTIKKKLSNK